MTDRKLDHYVDGVQLELAPGMPGVEYAHGDAFWYLANNDDLNARDGTSFIHTAEQISAWLSMLVEEGKDGK